MRERDTLRRRLAARVVLEHTLGRPIAAGMCACHTCDRPSCVNEDHLYEGTHKQNAHDRDTRTGCPFLRPDVQDKRRATVLREGTFRGDKHPTSRLTDEAVRVIRLLAATGVTHQRLADAHGVRRETVSQVVQRKTWAHVADTEQRAAA